MRKIFFYLLYCLSAISCTQNQDRPNIVWICAEDITTMLGCYGDPNTFTPNLDVFAEKSVKFTNAPEANTMLSRKMREPWDKLYEEHKVKAV